MTERPQNTLFRHDLRLTKKALHRTLTEFSDGKLAIADAIDQIRVLAADIPGLPVDKYVRNISMMLYAGNVNRARKLVDCFSDFAVRPGILVTLAILLIAAKWAGIIGTIVLIVWLILR